MADIEPTVGRVMWYRPSGQAADEQPLVGLVSYVHEDGTVNLAVFAPTGDHAGGRQNVPIRDAAADGDHAEWMPYQKAVATGAIPPTLHAEPLMQKPNPQGDGMQGAGAAPTPTLSRSVTNKETTTIVATRPKAAAAQPVKRAPAKAAVPEGEGRRAAEMEAVRRAPQMRTKREHERARKLYQEGDDVWILPAVLLSGDLDFDKMMKVSIDFCVGPYRCTMRLRNKNEIETKWRPHLPPQGSLDAAGIAQWRAGRDEFNGQLALASGGSAVLSVEAP